jgi:hypothetical protein
MMYSCTYKSIVGIAILNSQLPTSLAITGIESVWTTMQSTFVLVVLATMAFCSGHDSALTEPKVQQRRRLSGNIFSSRTPPVPKQDAVNQSFPSESDNAVLAQRRVLKGMRRGLLRNRMAAEQPSRLPEKKTVPVSEDTQRDDVEHEGGLDGSPLDPSDSRPCDDDLMNFIAVAEMSMSMVGLLDAVTSLDDVYMLRYP